jgi:hypothetical protein
VASTLDHSVKRPPSDFELLRAIYQRHRGDFTVPRAPSAVGVAVPIDIPAIAETLGTTSDAVWGRLYHHLDRIYGEAKPADGSARRALFIPGAAEENRINFPLLEAALAGLWQERNRQLWALWVSVTSIALALAALIVSVLTT